MSAGVRFDPAGLKKASFKEHAARFLFGGVVTVLTGLVAHAWGPEIGGLFLAFPAILPASLTLVKDHDGRRKVLEDARGARASSIGLLAFAICIFTLGERIDPALTLLVATASWLMVAALLWRVEFGARGGGGGGTGAP